MELEQFLELARLNNEAAYTRLAHLQVVCVEGLTLKEQARLSNAIAKAQAALCKLGDELKSFSGQ